MPPRLVEPPDAADLERAREVVASRLAPTPVVAHDGVWLKLETLQPTGSFKVRGALAALSALPRGARVITASAGNHALGVVHAAAELGLPARVIVPTTASPAKLSALRRLGADVERVGDDYDAAEAHALRLAADEAWSYVSSYNDRQLIAGQATVAAELLEELDGPLTIACPVGGGGLASGVALWTATHRGRARVVGVEAERSATMAGAFAADQIVAVAERPTIADGLAGGLEPGSVTFAILREHLADLVAVAEADIRAAVRDLATGAGLVVEGAGAAALAAVRAGRVTGPGRIAALVTGRNIAAPLLAEILMEGEAR